MISSIFLSLWKALTDLRNEFDVAHYTLDEAATQRVESECGDAKKTVEEVLRRYREALVRDGKGAAGALEAFRGMTRSALQPVSERTRDH